MTTKLQIAQLNSFLNFLLHYLSFHLLNKKHFRFPNDQCPSRPRGIVNYRLKGLTPKIFVKNQSPQRRQINLITRYSIKFIQVLTLMKSPFWFQWGEPPQSPLHTRLVCWLSQKENSLLEILGEPITLEEFDTEKESCACCM